MSRSKTVIKACRDRGQMLGVKPNLPAISDCDYHNAKKNNGICELRKIVVQKNRNEGLGISITGG